MEREIIEVIKSNPGLTSGELYRALNEKVTERTLRNYLKKLSEMNVIIVKETGKGFRGRSRKIYLNELYGV